jgi:hypothetical protein
MFLCKVLVNCTWWSVSFSYLGIFLLQLLFLDIIHRLCLRLQAEPTHLGPIDRASPYLRTPAPTEDRIHKPNTAQNICEIYDKY